MGVVAGLQRLARHPDQLGLDVRLEESVAVVEPASPSNPVHVALRPTALGEDVELHMRYLGSRWGAAGPVVGKLLRCLAVIVAPAWVLLRRCALPRWWAWILVTPKTGSDSQRARSGLLCVWTSPFAKARAWSSETGSFDLPAEGQTKSITLDLPYQMDGSKRSMRVSVRFRKVTPEGASAVPDSSPEDESELFD
jgi:hypothetical protein